MKRVLALFLVLICMLSVVACDKATGSGEPVRDGDVSDISEIDKNVSSETEQTQQANVESISGTISHIDEDKICDLTEEEVKIIRLIDRSLYMYVNSYKYKIGLKKIIDIKDIDLNSDKSIKNLIKKIINYTTKYENNEILNITNGRWL